MDAEHRARVGCHPDRTALPRARRRNPLRLPVRAVHGARSLRGCRDRPLRQPADGDRDAVRADGVLGAPRGAHPGRGRVAVGGLRDRRPHRHRSRLRRAVAAEPDVPDGRSRRVAERGRAELQPVQHGPHLWPRARRHPDRRVRCRLVLRGERGQLPRRARGVARDARLRALSARRPPPADRLAPARAKDLRTHAATRPCS